MKRALSVAAVLLALAWAGLAQDSCRVFVWDNDAGEPAQRAPAVCMDTSNNCYFVWADYRLLSWDIYGQRFDAATVTYDSCNFRINSTRGDGRLRRYPDVACDTAGWFVAAWEEYSSTLGYTIACRRFAPDGIGEALQTVVSRSATSVTKGYPKIARDKHSGDFVIVWQELRSTTYCIYARAYNRNGTAKTDTFKVNDATASAMHPDVAMNDTLVVITWADARNGHLDIYARNYYITTGSMAARGAAYLVNGDGTARKQDYPSVAMPCSTATTGANRYWVIAWEDARNFTSDISSDIYCRQYQPDGTTYGFERMVSQTRPARLASVCKGRNRFAFAVAWEDSGVGGWQVKLRYNDSRNVFDREKTVNNVAELPGKHGASSCLYRNYANVAFLDSSRALCRGDILEQGFSLTYGTTSDSMEQYYFNFKLNRGDKVRANGRTGWYHYPRYDNPLTSWNENPRPAAAADSVQLPLDSTYVRAVLSRNITPGQYYFRATDTDTFLAGRDQGKGTVNRDTYDVVLMDLGYATSELSAGSITTDQQDSLVKFVLDGGSLICSGNDFGEMYDGTVLFSAFGADYLGAGSGSATGNIDSLGGMSDAFSRGMAFHYPYQQEEDNSVDLIAPLSSSCDTLFGGDPSKWARCRGTFYSSYFKDGLKAAWHKNVYLPFVMTALTSDGRHPNTATELTRRMLGYQGFNVEPAPICDLAADTTSSAIEGTVTLRWAAVSDDSLPEAASDYLLKIREYNPALAEYGKITSEQEFVDSGQAYYQAWTPAAVGSGEARTLYLAPGRSYIYSLKAGDESSPTRWSALGTEPLSQTRGDTLTPHTLYLGSLYGLCNQFAPSERLDIDGGDTLSFTWDAGSLYFGFSRIDLRARGDLFIYLDTRSGGADSTIGDWNGAAADTAALFDEGKNFKPDFCFALDSLGNKCKLMYWTGTAWAESIGTYSPSYYTLDLLNNTLLSTIRVLRSKVGSPASLKFMAVRLYETSERCYSSFPPANPTGVKGAKAIARYPFYYSVGSLANGLSPRNAAAPLAVALSQFSASAGDGSVQLSWSTESENNNYQWLIERSRHPDRDFALIATVPAHGGTAGHDYRYTDGTAAAGNTYYYLLGDLDLAGDTTWHGPVSATVPSQPVAGLWLGQCDPNPVRGPAEIAYAVPQPGRVTLQVYDICGRKVRTVVDGDQGAGRYRAPWGGDDDRGRPLASGIYFYRLSHDGRQATGKLVVVR